VQTLTAAAADDEYDPLSPAYDPAAGWVSPTYSPPSREQSEEGGDRTPP
jgi:hypothetical protein